MTKFRTDHLLITNIVEKNSRVLDIGCADGKLLHLLIKNKNAYDISIDASKLDILFLINAYSIRIFFDFWAYSLMAIGIAKLFSIDLPINFKEPYQTKNPKEFWRRWHVRPRPRKTSACSTTSTRDATSANGTSPGPCPS